MRFPIRQISQPIALRGSTKIAGSIRGTTQRHTLSNAAAHDKKVSGKKPSKGT